MVPAFGVTTAEVIVRHRAEMIAGRSSEHSKIPLPHSPHANVINRGGFGAVFRQVLFPSHLP
jgi:hypothetical protein